MKCRGAPPRNSLRIQGTGKPQPPLLTVGALIPQGDPASGPAGG